MYDPTNTNMYIKVDSYVLRCLNKYRMEKELLKLVTINMKNL